MTDNYKKVLELIGNNEELKNKIMEIEKEASSIEEIIDKVNPLISEFGLSLSVNDVDMSAGKTEISADELENASGGMMWEINGLLTTDCFCMVGGGGTSDEYQNTCACVLAGFGTLTELGKRERDRGRLNTVSDKYASFCAGVGM